MDGTTPICRCRVLYLGSAVPHVTKDGLQGIQEPLRDLYPDKGGSVSAKGIDSWLSVWSNGLLLENVDERKRQVTRFFPVDTLHYCAAVRFVLVPGTSGEKVQRFLPLDSPFARNPNLNHPPVFACILRRTTGIKVLECHAFICKKESAANALVRCCFHAYADSTYARHLEESTTYNGVGSRAQSTLMAGTVPTLDTVRKVEEWRQRDDDEENGRMSPDSATGSENYKVWHGPSHTEKEMVYVDYSGTLKSVKSTNEGNSTLDNPVKTNARQRQRQVISPAPALPPPNSIVTAASNKINKGPSSKSGTQKSNKSKAGKRSKMYMNGNMHSLPRPPPPGPIMMVRGPPPPRGHPGLVYRHPMSNHPMANHPNAIYSVPHRVMVDPRMVHPPPHDPRFIIQPPVPEHGTFTKQSRRAIEEPIYMPQSARPTSPVASYQPGAFNHEQYYQQQQYSTTPRPEAQYKKKKGKSSKSSDVESPFNTGIYKKKGHLNERAFSYSIRQEHRSRSNSLSNLKYFAENGEMPGPEDQHKTNNNNVVNKKDKEMAQLVNGLEIHENGHHHHHKDNGNFIKKKNPAFNGGGNHH